MSLYISPKYRSILDRTVHTSTPSEILIISSNLASYFGLMRILDIKMFWGVHKSYILLITTPEFAEHLVDLCRTFKGGGLEPTIWKKLKMTVDPKDPQGTPTFGCKIGQELKPENNYDILDFSLLINK